MQNQNNLLSDSNYSNSSSYLNSKPLPVARSYNRGQNGHARNQLSKRPNKKSILEQVKAGAFKLGASIKGGFNKNQQNQFSELDQKLNQIKVNQNNQNLNPGFRTPTLFTNNQPTLHQLVNNLNTETNFEQSKVLFAKPCDIYAKNSTPSHQIADISSQQPDVGEDYSVISQGKTTYITNLTKYDPERTKQEIIDLRALTKNYIRQTRVVIGDSLESVVAKPLIQVSYSNKPRNKPLNDELNLEEKLKIDSQPVTPILENQQTNWSEIDNKTLIVSDTFNNNQVINQKNSPSLVNQKNENLGQKISQVLSFEAFNANPKTSLNIPKTSNKWENLPSQFNQIDIKPGFDQSHYSKDKINGQNFDFIKNKQHQSTQILQNVDAFDFSNLESAQPPAPLLNSFDKFDKKAFVADFQNLELEQKEKNFNRSVSFNLFSVLLLPLSVIKLVIQNLVKLTVFIGFIVKNLLKIIFLLTSKAFGLISSFFANLFTSKKVLLPRLSFSIPKAYFSLLIILILIAFAFITGIYNSNFGTANSQQLVAGISEGLIAEQNIENLGVNRTAQISYATWLIINDLSDTTKPEDDLDGDGLSNYEEYLIRNQPSSN